VRIGNAFEARGTERLDRLAIRLVFHAPIQENVVATKTGRFQWENRGYLGNSNNVENTVETVNGIRNIIDAHMHCKAPVLSGTIASTGE